MKLLADMHIAPRTIRFLQSLGHDVVRVDEVLSPTASDAAIVTAAIREGRNIITQDLDLSAIVALSGRTVPSVISLRLSSSRVERVNAVLEEVLAAVETDLLQGAMVTVQDGRIRCRRLPVTCGGT
jgi:predicted nuclease of predicted toxin-antitoxin system